MAENEEDYIEPAERHYQSIKARAEEAELEDFGSPELVKKFNQELETARAEIQQQQDAGKPLSEELQAWNRYMSEQEET